MNKICLVLCLITVPHTESVKPSRQAPKIAISFPDIADNDFHNETTAMMSNANPIFQMECNSSYPIEWIIHYSEEDDGTSEKSKTAEVKRHVEEFTNPYTYTYIVKIRMEYNGKLLVFSNFTCKSTETEDTKLQTHVYMRGEKKKSIIFLEISQEKKGTNTSHVVEDINDNCGKTTATVSDTTKLIPCWSCEKPTGEELQLDYITCWSVIQCQSMHSRQNKGRECLKVLGNQSEHTNCTIFQSFDYNPKAIVCKHYGPSLAQFYFFGVFRGDIEDDNATGPAIYYDWSEIDPKEMLYIHPVKNIVYSGEHISIVCEYSRYYFALGSWFGILSDNGMEYIKGDDVRPCDFEVDCREASNHAREGVTTEESWRGTYKAVLNTTFDKIGLRQVFCFGPVWNSTKWVNASATFNVTKGERPQVVSITADGSDKFIVGQRYRTLTCNFKGKPLPTVEWNGPSESIYSTAKTDTNSQITFSEIGFQTAGTYTCTVASFLGNHSKSFELKSRPWDTAMSKVTVVIIVLTCLGITAIVIVVIARMTHIIREQRKALRILTEAEIKEFVDGNPEIAERAKNDYFNNVSAIDALPYDKKYEIAAERLAIDYSSILGTGEFGLVLKGKVIASAVPQYVVLAVLDATGEKQSENGELVVAVKVCKKNVDVNNFKVLLSEIKVMAYLGHHKNLVCLIAASTENIRNRELFIAVEFCKNGSLDTYLRRNKNKFLNKVKYGYLSENNDSSTYLSLFDEAGGDYLSQAQMCIFSTVELLKWTLDIAEGIEYMQNKKVIHGDLAVRNILLTQNLTAKIGDFGLSRQLVETSSYTKRTHSPLPWRHMAIESLKNLEFSVKSDMWALGVTYWEMWTLGDVPYPGINYSQDFARQLEEGMRCVKPPYATNDTYEFMLMCWSKSPEDRPTTTEIKRICSKLLRSLEAIS